MNSETCAQVSRLYHAALERSGIAALPIWRTSAGGDEIVVVRRNRYWRTERLLERSWTHAPGHPAGLFLRLPVNGLASTS